MRLIHLYIYGFCDIMVNRIIAHMILIVSVLSLSIIFAGYYGNVVEVITYDNTDFDWWQLPANYSITGNVESISFGQDILPNDTITITVTNSGDFYWWIQSIQINEENHNVDAANSFIFDSDGYFYYTRIVPPGGFGVIRLNTESVDLTPKDGVYDVAIITNGGVLAKSFVIENSTFRNPSFLNSLTPFLIVILFTSYVSLHYYRRFQIPE